MDNFIDVFGDVTVSRAAVVIAALLFLVGCYRKISKYFRQKAINDYKQNEQIKEVIDQSKHYPEWRQQSIDVQVKLTDQIETIIGKMEGLEKANGEGMAYTWRYRILRFNDEVDREQDIQRNTSTKFWRTSTAMKVSVERILNSLTTKQCSQLRISKTFTISASKKMISYSMQCISGGGHGVSVSR